MREPKPEFFTCPFCKEEVEIWSDEFSATCPGCGKVVVRDRVMSCLEWCDMARECVGDGAYESFNAHRSASIKERILAGTSDSKKVEVERLLHITEQLSYAENANLHVTLPAAVFSILFENRPGLARKQLLTLGYQLEDADEVCAIVEGHDSMLSKGSVNSAVVHDALLLALRMGNGTAATGFLTETAAKLRD